MFSSGLLELHHLCPDEGSSSGLISQSDLCKDSSKHYTGQILTYCCLDDLETMSDLEHGMIPDTRAALCGSCQIQRYPKERCAKGPRIAPSRHRSTCIRTSHHTQEHCGPGPAPFRTSEGSSVLLLRGRSMYILDYTNPGGQSLRLVYANALASGIRRCLPHTSAENKTKKRFLIVQ